MLLVWWLVALLRVCQAVDMHAQAQLQNNIAGHTVTAAHNTTLGQPPGSFSVLSSVLFNNYRPNFQSLGALTRVATSYSWNDTSTRVRSKREVNGANNFNYNDLSNGETRSFKSNTHRANNLHSVNDEATAGNEYNSRSNNNEYNLNSVNSEREDNNVNNTNNDGDRETISSTASPPTSTSVITTTAGSTMTPTAIITYPEDEVLWGRLCSPRFVLVHRHHDVALRCEVWAPLGTIIRWRKEAQTLRTDFYDNEDSEGNSLDLGHEPVAPTDYSSTRQNVHSFFFLDCAHHGHRGTFEMLVLSPSGRTYSRHFSVFIMDSSYLAHHDGRRGLMCVLPPQQRRLLPRIHAFSRVVVAPVGTNLTLPCRYRGDHMAVTWLFQEQPTNFTVTSKGDLLIPGLTPLHAGFFMCLLRSTVLHADLSDRIITSVQPQVHE
ncbi:uncharacterized protein LOC108680837 [Hyalella azteca]|uniref:Uncharacterized protein LOC108680837 n=1 Tax=Hyalella azteca TaxID=294128 RepID=A0A8B7PIS1_HYAAZ|nr:uncharacterized protein LOC108680837 [Hyalella azteca]